MPIYEYKCQKCGHKFEKLIFKKERVKCPKCKSTFIKKLISNVNITGKSSKGSESSNTCPTCKV